MEQILIIEDDIAIGNLLEEALVKQNYLVIRAYSGTEALYVLQQEHPNLILLDLMLPGLQGEDILPYVKEIPVIVMSAKTDVKHKVDVLLEGAVDYITKPFHLDEVLARITAQLRKLSSSYQASTISYYDMILHTDMQMVSIKDKKVKLTKTENAILKILMQNSSQVVTKSFLLDHISLDTLDCSENSLKMHISNLRKKLKTLDQKEYIESVWGIGFTLKNK